MKTHKLIVTMLLVMGTPHFLSAVLGKRPPVVPPAEQPDIPAEPAAPAVAPAIAPAPGDINEQLMAAVRAGNENRVRALVGQRANVNYENITGSVLSIAIALNRTAIALFLIDNGADIHDQDLINAINNDNTDITQTLIAHGANVNAQDVLGVSPLILASEHRLTAIVRLLIAHGADVNKRTRFGETALMLAGKRIDLQPAPSADIVRALLDAPGIKVNARDQDGHTALDFAQDPQIREMLIQAGARLGHELERE